MITRFSLQLVVFSLFWLRLAQSLAVELEVDEPKIRCIESEKQALLNIKENLQNTGDTDFLSSWGNETEKRECCKWLGIRCASGSSGHVIMLDLSPSTLGISTDNIWWSRPFAGKIDPSLFELRYLTYLDLSFINFNRSHIPSSIESFSKMTVLTYLDLSFNSLRGSIPECFGNMTTLAHLSLASNKLEGSIPNALGNNFGLSYLDLRGNNIEGSIPEAFGNMTSLSFLNLELNL
ncbi:hypothetical protein TIFTF001_056177, partial [Ficus carica]